VYKDHFAEYQSSLAVLQSKQRCQMRGLDPKHIPAPLVATQDNLTKIQHHYMEVLQVVKFFVPKFLNMVKGTPILIVVTDDQGTILYMEGDSAIKNTIQRLGFQPGVIFSEEYNGTNSISLALKFNQPIQLIASQHYNEFLHQSACYSVPIHGVESDAQIGTISIMTTLEHGNPLLLTLLSTIADSIEREMLLRSQNRDLNILNQIVTDSTKTGIILTDKHGCITEFNQYAEKLTGWRKQTVLNQQVSQLETIGPLIEDVLSTRETFSDIEVKIENASSSVHKICLFDGRPIYSEQGELIGAFGNFRDITERYEAEVKMNYMAYHDDLTSCPNRRYFQRFLGESLERAMTNGNTLAVFLLDLDRFKLINDTLGHSKGDFVLMEISRRLSDYLGDEGKLFRMGGDEFTVVFPHINDQADAVQIAKDIIRLVREPFVIQECEFHISTSIGISFYPHDGHGVNDLLIQADTALYRAKEKGKNGYMIYNSNMKEKSFQKLTLETELKNAIDNNDLIVYYQPQIDLKSGNIIGVESLLRWNHPQYGMISPVDFIPLAEEMGLMVTLGEWVLRNTCQQMRIWHDKGFPSLRVAVNLSSQEFLKQGLVETIKQILLETGLKPDCLELEITESMTMDVERSISILNDLNRLGIQMAIDDFGTGYSSLNYLKNFAIHRLKIDRSFVRDIMKDGNDAKIVGTIISMAHALNLEVLAEGVEEEEQVSFLRKLNCDQAQGYYYSKPLPAEEIEKMLINQKK
jgi:diguanylate cyclase (GGDEF)-like protein/PAS domain S-box-containing protein